ncbi:terminase small subunit [Aquabacterium sp.]|uniref:terminase small subunit n=1 Tax=Aquabacterium sp. TaxID=1872578 RepID=UPI0025C46482|nr:terminase small subunit [Aquabacterium sp.]
MTINLNRADLATHMGVTPVTIDNWRKAGMPVVQRGSRGVEWVFDLPAVIKWYTEEKVKQAMGDAPTDLTEIEKRTASAKMQKAELELAKARGDVAPIREFERAQAKAFAQVRANVMNVPQRVVIQLLGETDEAKFKQTLRAELVLALQAAAEAELTLADEDEAVEEEE